MERRQEPREGSEIDPETQCLQGVGADFGLWRRAFCRTIQRVNFVGEAKSDDGATVKARVNSPSSRQD